jgi:hypothetical protein
MLAKIVIDPISMVFQYSEIQYIQVWCYKKCTIIIVTVSSTCN